MARTKQQARKGGKGRHNKNKGNEQRRDDRDNEEGKGRRGNYKMCVTRDNEQFEKFYKAQNLVPEGQWEDFMSTLRKPLPATFRITSYKSQKEDMLGIIKNEYLSKLMHLKIDDEDFEPPKSLPWYPGELAWQINYERKTIRQCNDLKKLHQFLVQETESGNISRQEAVSMIPPILLDVEPHHKVLDMCAAPGSKTAQLIELLHAKNDTTPDGFVVANDCDNKRCYMMVHQVRRLETASFIIINHDAQFLPNLKYRPEPDAELVNLKYDRVLADVPCSGDGTLRKNPDIWGKWKVSLLTQFHGVQMRIAKRGLELLEVGGRMVYSTCTFNPIEDEAVVAQLLQNADGAVELVDVSDKLTGLQYVQGLTTWKLMTREGDYFSTVEDIPPQYASMFRPTMLPPTPEKAEAMGLNRCIRVLPHHQNTGGFFIAVLKKVGELPWMKTPAPTQTVSSSSTDKPAVDGATGGGATGDGATGDGATGDGAQAATTGEQKPASTVVDTFPMSGKHKRKQMQLENSGENSGPPNKRMFGYKEDPFIYLKEDEEIWPGIKNFYKLSDDFPVTQLMIRCDTGKKRHIYFTSAAVKNVVSNTLAERSDIKFINMGMKVFSRSESRYVNCDFRMVQDGMGLVFPYMGGRIVKISKADIIVLLSQDYPFFAKMTPGVKDQLDLIDQGGLAYLYEPDGSPDSPRCTIVLCGWRGKTSCRSFLPRFERAHYLRLCGVDLKTREEILTEKKVRMEQGDGAMDIDDGKLVVCVDDLGTEQLGREINPESGEEKGQSETEGQGQTQGQSEGQGKSEGQGQIEGQGQSENGGQIETGVQ